jgi:ribokinase
VIGAINWDVSIFEQRFARAGEEVPVRLVEEYSGGKGANVAVAAARILGPGRVALVGALGDDEVSGMQVTGLTDEGVSTEGLAIIRGRRSGRAYIVVDREGRKSIHTHFGANDELQPSHLSNPGALEALSKSAMVVVMDAPTRVGRRATELASKVGSRIVYSPGVRTRDGLPALEDIIRRADTLVLDRNELKNLLRTGEVAAAVEKLRGRHPGVTIVATLGQAGCIVAKGKAINRVEGVNLAKLGLRAVNSTGSGDAFLGAYACYTLMGKSPVEAVAWANLAGALKATRYETRGSPTKKELESRMSALEAVRRSPPGSRASRAS